MRHLPIIAAAALLPAIVFAQAPPETDAAAVETLKALARPLICAEALDPLIARATQARLVLLGEATHGTSEFYTWRAAISKRLIQEQGFRFIVVEGDWADIYRLNRHVRHLPGAETDARAIMRTFRRWPTWMWANEETLALIEWLREYNHDRPPSDRVGFYGMDVYGDDQALTAMLSKLDRLDAALAEETRSIYLEFLPYAGNLDLYVRALRGGKPSFADGAQAGYRLLEERLPALLADNPAAHFNILQSARVVKHAEAHYRAMQDPALNSWNKRADHFHDTVARLIQRGDGQARGVVWAHNTHIGDARATTMAQGGQRNIGMMARSDLGAENVLAVGFGTWRGTVVAGARWGAPPTRMTLPESAPGSYETLLNAIGMPTALIIFDPDAADFSPLDSVRGHRAVGVVYNPAHEVPGNYVPTRLTRRYDAFIFIRETTALHPVDE